jgi:peptide/nickel transport system substrate-binding protein
MRLRLLASLVPVLCLGLTLPLHAREPARPQKVVDTVMAAEGLKGFDPCQTGDTTSAGMVSQVYDALYEYHYLKRPYELKPALADGMPQVSDDGLTWTIKMKKGVVFQDNRCFPGGKGREATVHDVIYSFKRLADPANKPRGYWLIDGRIKGLDEFHKRAAERARRREPTPYAEEQIAGLRTLDNHTLQISLTAPTRSSNTSWPCAMWPQCRTRRWSTTGWCSTETPSARARFA